MFAYAWPALHWELSYCFILFLVGLIVACDAWSPAFAVSFYIFFTITTIIFDPLVDIFPDLFPTHSTIQESHIILHHSLLHLWIPTGI